MTVSQTIGTCVVAVFLVWEAVALMVRFDHAYRNWKRCRDALFQKSTVVYLNRMIYVRRFCAKAMPMYHIMNDRMCWLQHFIQDETKVIVTDSFVPGGVYARVDSFYRMPMAVRYVLQTHIEDENAKM